MKNCRFCWKFLPFYSILRYFVTKARENAHLKKKDFLFFSKNRKRKITKKEEMVTHALHVWWWGYTEFFCKIFQSSVIAWHDLGDRFMYDTGLLNFSQKCPLLGFWLISTNFGSLIPNPKSVFGCVVWILHCCQFCVFFRVKIYIFDLFSKFIIFKNLSFFNMKRE